MKRTHDVITVVPEWDLLVSMWTKKTFTVVWSRTAAFQWYIHCCLVHFTKKANYKYRLKNI